MFTAVNYHFSQANDGDDDIVRVTPSSGRLVISDIRIPLMWKNTDYFKNKGSKYH